MSIIINPHDKIEPGSGQSRQESETRDLVSVNNNYFDHDFDEEVDVFDGYPSSMKKKRRCRTLILAAIIVVAIIVPFVWNFLKPNEVEEDFKTTDIEVSAISESQSVAGAAKAYTSRQDVTVGDVMLTILTPKNAIPSLVIGDEITQDSSVVLIAQAADVRADNGGIVGSFVVKGQLMGRGESKAGFCSIINNEITLGVAESSPMFEQAMTSDGYFFRQFPLVVSNQVIENGREGESIRRALAEINGSFSVITSKNRVSIDDFSRALVEIGVRNAIYLVGGHSLCNFRDADNHFYTNGKKWDPIIENANYIVWKY